MKQDPCPEIQYERMDAYKTLRVNAPVEAEKFGNAKIANFSRRSLGGADGTPGKGWGEGDPRLGALRRRSIET